MSRARDLFAGAGGWDVAAGQLGWTVDGVENNPAARVTRDAAGLSTTGFDVRDVQPVRGTYDVDIASPPCQSFSMAGTGSGRRALDVVLSAIDAYDIGEPPTPAELTAATGDERTALVLEPLRVALAGRSPYLAWEQVPAVLPVWRACAELLEAVGYSVAVGVLDAERYGVPQTRRRAVLVARADGGTAVLPEPTHSRYHVRAPERLDPGVKPWVSMAEALGWAEGVCGFPRLADRANTVTIDGTAYRSRDLRSTRLPAQVVTEKARSWQRWALRNGSNANACTRSEEQPSGTLFFGPQLNDVRWHHDGGSRRITVAEAAALQTFPAGFPFQGSNTARFTQIGNAIPPVLALAVLDALGVPS